MTLFRYIESYEITVHIVQTHNAIKISVHYIQQPQWQHFIEIQKKVVINISINITFLTIWQNLYNKIYIQMNMATLNKFAIYFYILQFYVNQKINLKN